MKPTREEERQLRHTTGRKRVDLVAAMSRPSGRDTIWRTIRRLRTFTLPTLERECGVVRSTIESYLQGLVKAGYLSRSERQRGANASGVVVFQAATYELTRDCGVDAPRVTRQGTPVTQGIGREALWTAIRGLRDFDYAELRAVASTAQHQVATEEARDYIKHLAQAGYLRVTRPSQPGTPARYRLIPTRNTGPKAPQIQRIQQVYDANENRVVWPIREEA